MPWVPGLYVLVFGAAHLLTFCIGIIAPKNSGVKDFDLSAFHGPLFGGANARDSRQAQASVFYYGYTAPAYLHSPT